MWNNVQGVYHTIGLATAYGLYTYLGSLVAGGTGGTIEK